MPEPERCLVLASASPRRSELLSQLVGGFTVIVSGVPEPIDANLTPAENVLSIARAKAGAVAQQVAECLVLAADTDVVLDGEILGKPADEHEASAMLRRLRGRSHEVITAVVLVDTASGSRWEEAVRSVVHINRLSDDEIAAYVATGEPMDKAGGYAIQGEAASMVNSVSGCYTNVVGLPICATKRMLDLARFPTHSAAICAGADGRPMPHDH